jgi:hypothetical protein
MNLLLKLYAPPTIGRLHVCHKPQFLAEPMGKHLCDASRPHSQAMKYGSHSSLQIPMPNDYKGGKVQPSTKHA